MAGREHQGNNSCKQAKICKHARHLQKSAAVEPRLHELLSCCQHLTKHDAGAPPGRRRCNMDKSTAAPKMREYNSSIRRAVAGHDRRSRPACGPGAPRGQIQSAGVVMTSKKEAARPAPREALHVSVHVLSQLP
eukprot:365942-Chlamydomonas_euryale.AAC.18